MALWLCVCPFWALKGALQFWVFQDVVAKDQRQILEMVIQLHLVDIPKYLYI